MFYFPSDRSRFVVPFIVLLALDYFIKCNTLSRLFTCFESKSCYLLQQTLYMHPALCLVFESFLRVLPYGFNNLHCVFIRI